MKIILDTNFLIYCSKEKLDYEEELAELINEPYELVVPEQVLAELEKLKNIAKKGRDKQAASIALQILEKKGIKKIKAEGESVDEAIINLAKEDSKNIVCTLDREMRHILGRVILLNRKKRFILTK